MPAPAERPGVTIEDVIAASGAGETPFSHLAFRSAVLGHGETMPSEEELLRLRQTGTWSPVSFMVRPVEGQMRMRYVERDDRAETVLCERAVTDTAPFQAQRYSLKLRPGEGLEEGLIEFQGGIRVGHVGFERAQRVVRGWVMGVTLSGLEKVSITERHNGLMVATWAGGRLVDAAGSNGNGTAAAAAAEAAGPVEAEA